MFGRLRNFVQGGRGMGDARGGVDEKEVRGGGVGGVRG